MQIWSKCTPKKFDTDWGRFFCVLFISKGRFSVDSTSGSDSEVPRDVNWLKHFLWKSMGDGFQLDLDADSTCEHTLRVVSAH